MWGLFNAEEKVQAAAEAEAREAENAKKERERAFRSKSFNMGSALGGHAAPSSPWTNNNPLPGSPRPQPLPPPPFTLGARPGGGGHSPNGTRELASGERSHRSDQVNFQLRTGSEGSGSGFGVGVAPQLGAAGGSQPFNQQQHHHQKLPSIRQQHPARADAGMDEEPPSPSASDAGEPPKRPPKKSKSFSSFGMISSTMRRVRGILGVDSRKPR